MYLCVPQTIILLYLFDNDTSWLILFSSSIGLVIEVWKVKKAMDFQFIPVRIYRPDTYTDIQTGHICRLDTYADRTHTDWTRTQTGLRCRLDTYADCKWLPFGCSESGRFLCVTLGVDA